MAFPDISEERSQLLPGCPPMGNCFLMMGLGFSTLPGVPQSEAVLPQCIVSEAHSVTQPNGGPGDADPFVSVELARFLQSREIQSVSLCDS